MYIPQRGVFVSLFISTMVFGDTSYMMSKTGLTLEPKYKTYHTDNQDYINENHVIWYHKVPVVFYFSQVWYFIDIYDSWLVTQKIIELPIRYVDDIQRNGIHIIHFQNMYFLYETKKGKSLLFRILFISYHLKNHQNFIGVITKEYSISRLLFSPTYNVSKSWCWVVEEQKWSLYLQFYWVLTK